MRPRCHFTSFSPSIGILPLYGSPIFSQLWPFHRQMLSARGQVLLDFGLLESFTWTNRQIERQLRTRKEWHEERKRIYCKWPGGRENEGEYVLSYKSLRATKAVFSRTNPSAGTYRQENAFFLCYSVNDDWQLISPSELNPVEMLYQGCLNPVLRWPQTSRSFCMQTPLHCNDRKHNWCVQHFKMMAEIP